MDWTTAAARGAINQWRDHSRLTAASALNAAAVEALSLLDQVLSTAAWQDRTRFVVDTIDLPMRQAVEARLSDILQKAARDLRMIDRRLEPLALQLRREVWPEFPKLRSPARPTHQEAAEFVLPETLAGWTAVRTAFSMAKETVRAAQFAADDAGVWLRDKAGVHDDLRKRAKAHLCEVWLDNNPTSRTVLSQIDQSFDAADQQAKEMIE